MAENKVFVLHCGAQVEWKYKDAFQNYHLEIVKPPDDQMGCGNPWNLMTEDEMQLIKSKRPPAVKKPCNLKCALYHKVIEKDKLGFALQDALTGDCWGVFATTDDRKQVTRTYFDTRNAPYQINRDKLSLEEFHKQGDEADAERDRLIENPSCLIDDIENNLTVCIVLGGDEFIEQYYFKVNGGYVRTSVDHSIDW